MDKQSRFSYILLFSIKSCVNRLGKSGPILCFQQYSSENSEGIHLYSSYNVLTWFEPEIE